MALWATCSGIVNIRQTTTTGFKWHKMDINLFKSNYIWVLYVCIHGSPPLVRGLLSGNSLGVCLLSYIDYPGPRAALK